MYVSNSESWFIFGLPGQELLSQLSGLALGCTHNCVDTVTEARMRQQEHRKAAKCILG
jgi:hypothetical protein